MKNDIEAGTRIKWTGSPNCTTRRGTVIGPSTLVVGAMGIECDCGTTFTMSLKQLSPINLKDPNDLFRRRRRDEG